MRIIFFGTPEFAVPSLDTLRRGGHEVAAVVTQPDRPHGRSRSKLVPPPVKVAALAAGLEVLQPEDLFPRVRIDTELPLGEITPELLAGLDRLAPFGQGNPAPLFASGPVEVSGGPKTLKERHLSVGLTHAGRTFRAIMWRGVEWAPVFEAHRGAVEVAYCMERNTFQGVTTIELRLSAVRGAARAALEPAASLAADSVPRT